MRTSLALAFLASLVALAVPRRAAAQATAEPVTAAAPPPSVAGWNLGGGVTTVSWSTAGSTVVSTIQPAAAPGATASLERRLSSRLWLALGVRATFDRTRADAPASGGYVTTRDDRSIVQGTIGVRQEVTGPAAPVAVSVLALAGGGWSDGEQRWSNGTDMIRSATRGWMVSASVGLAVERELTRGLALRVSTPLLAVGHGRTRIEEDGAPARTADGLTAAVTIAPSLELRLAF